MLQQPQMKKEEEMRIWVWPWTSPAWGTPPAIASNTLILGICGTNLVVSCPKRDGWFMADFYAFNCLWEDWAIAQKWLAMVSPQELLSNHKTRKIVLSEDLLLQDKTTMPDIVSPGLMVEAFYPALKEYRDWAIIYLGCSTPSNYLFRPYKPLSYRCFCLLATKCKHH